MKLGWKVTALASALAVCGAVVGRASGPGILAMFSPARHPAITSGEPVVELAPFAGVDVALVGVVRTTIDDERLVAWFRQVEQLQQGRYIPIIRRFSNPPRIDDLAELELDDNDLRDLCDCRPGDCNVKLAGAEMRRINEAIAAAGRHWKPAAQAAFRQVLLERVQAHLAGGFTSAPPYEDHRRSAVLAVEFEQLLNGMHLTGLCTESVIAHLRTYPAASANVETLLFWSRDTLGDLKPTVGITQVSIVRGQGPADPTIIASSQVYATHYLTASLSVVAVTPTDDGEANYLVYARRSRGDMFHGMFGGWLRRIVQKRVRAEGPGVLDALRRKMEAGPPARFYTN